MELDFDIAGEQNISSTSSMHAIEETRSIQLTTQRPLFIRNCSCTSLAYID